MSKMIKFDEEYKKWVEEISKRFRKSQIKAAMKVNDEMLRFYWSLGCDMDRIKESYDWGSHFYSQISKDIQKVLPDVKSFSSRNLLYMHQFYRMYPDALITPQVGAQLTEEEFAHQNGAQLHKDIWAGIFGIPWGHHKLILDKCKDDQSKALFFVSKTMENNWSRSVLLNFLETDLYDRQGKAITNFAQTLPGIQGDLAQAITKDPYNFDFLTLREKYDEKELKDALMEKVQSFLLELGTGFAYMGREVRIKVGNKEKFIDLLFYNTRVHCYVVVEIKAGEFDSENMGQLGTYVVAVNHQIKTDQDNPTIGLVVCKDMDKVEAQYAVEASSQPLGISSYELSKLVPEKFKGSLPTIEEIEEELSDE
jgi:predicted nuclease of restriction endonuclease-like (RecB) superfamily